MSDPVVVPGARDVRGSLSDPDADVCVVACPPHPRYGGTRADSRLLAVADALADREIACLRFDYGSWDEGRGERADAGNAVAWARKRYERVGLFGYSFGAAVALVVAAETPSLCALSVLAPPAEIERLDALAAVDAVTAPLQVLYGERDETVDWNPVVEAAGEQSADLVSLSSDHSFASERTRIGALVAEFVVEHC